MSHLRSTNGHARSLVRPGRTGTLLLAGLLVTAAIRVVHGQAAQPEAPLALATTYLPPDTIFAVLVRPAELAVPELMQPVVDAVDELLKPANLGISVADIDECKVVFLGVPDMMRGPPNFYLVIRAKRAVDWKKVFGVTRELKEEEVGGRKLYIRGQEAFWLPDERTIVVGSREAAKRTTENPDPNDRAAWSDRWEKAAKSPLAGFLHVNMLGLMSLPGPDGKLDKSLASLDKDVKYAVLEGNVTDKGFAVGATIFTNSNEGSVRAAPVVSRGLTNFASMIATQTGLAGDDADRLTEQLSGLLGSTQIVTQGETVEIKALVTPKMIDVFAETARLIGGQ
ncbi:MAG: hypothetical protein WD063_04910 [Pirellulales bacterium]